MKYVFVKQHKVRDADEKKPSNRTLFVVNVPCYMSEECLTELFSSCGPVENIYLHDKPTIGQPVEESRLAKFFNEPGIKNGFQVAYVVFHKASSMKNLAALQKAEPIVLQTIEFDMPLGPCARSRLYAARISKPEELKKEIEELMAEYDQKVELEKQKAKEIDGVPDEEGWITVTKHSRNPVIPRTEAANQRLITKDKKKRSQKALLNFYSFQVKQSKMEHLAEMRKKFLEDKERLALMKSHRKFRPY